MKISEMILVLDEIKKNHGDIPCIIEVPLDYSVTDTEVNELSVEDRPEFGLSVKFIM